MSKKYRKVTSDDLQFISSGFADSTQNHVKRQLRKQLLSAYDTYKSSVIYEGIEESVEERNRILEWKKELLDLKSEAFKMENIPEKIRYYL